MAPDQASIDAQFKLLAEHRRTLAILREQVARQGGTAYALPGTLTSIAEAQEQIARAKAYLRAHNLPVDDQPNDIAAPPSGPAGRAFTPTLHQLRAPVADFVGRAEQLDALVDALAKGGSAAAISGLRGMGGIGKTELAYAAAQRLAAHFPDAQILIELGGAGPSPLAPEAAQDLNESRLGANLAILTLGTL